MGIRINMAALLLAMLMTGTAQAQDEGGADAEMAKPYTIETQWEQTTIGDASVTLSMHLDIEPGDAYERFVQDIGYWWSRDFTMGGPATQVMMLEAFTGGRLYEVYESGEAQWAEVLLLEEGHYIVLGIPEGTFWSGAGSISISFEPGESGGSEMLLTHRAFQAWDPDSDGAAGYAQGWSLLVGENFRRYCNGETIADAVIPAESDNTFEQELP